MQFKITAQKYHEKLPERLKKLGFVITQAEDGWFETVDPIYKEFTSLEELIAFVKECGVVTLVANNTIYVELP